MSGITVSLSDDEAAALLVATGIEIDALAHKVYERMLELINAGEKPQVAIDIALKEFNAPYYSVLKNSLGKILARSIGIKDIRDFPVGKIKLSDKLHQGAQQTAAVVRQIIKDHTKFEHDARELARKLFEGYGFRNNEVIIPKVALPKYMQDAALEDEVNALLAQIQALKIKSDPLRIAYLNALDAILANKGELVRNRALEIAIYERHRFFADRIAQHELARVQMDMRAKELRKQKELQIVQVKLSQSHPKRDICDMFASQNLYGLGPGLYPKADCPRPPFHPFCRCVLRPRLDLIGQKIGKYQSEGTSNYLKSLSPQQAAQVAGSQAKLQALLEGASIEDIFNAGKPPEYALQLIGE